MKRTQMQHKNKLVRIAHDLVEDDRNGSAQQRRNQQFPPIEVAPAAFSRTVSQLKGFRIDYDRRPATYSSGNEDDYPSYDFSTLSLGNGFNIL